MPTKRKSSGLRGIGPLHWNRRQKAGWPDNVVNQAVSPETSTSAASSTTTSMVHFPLPPPPVIVARRGTPAANADWVSIISIAAPRNVRMLFFMVVSFRSKMRLPPASGPVRQPGRSSRHRTFHL
jgi:hypothetical protein